jgi:DNA-binding IscR family transcriptional regulator
MIREGCECRRLYCEINRAIKSTLAKYTLLDLERGEAGFE